MDFFEEDFALDFFVADFFALDFFALDFFALDFLVVLFFEPLLAVDLRPEDLPADLLADLRPADLLDAFFVAMVMTSSRNVGSLRLEICCIAHGAGAIVQACDGARRKPLSRGDSMQRPEGRCCLRFRVAMGCVSAGMREKNSFAGASSTEFASFEESEAASLRRP